MNTKFTKTVAVTGLTVSAFVAVCGFANTAFADEAPAVVNTPVENPAPGSFRARLLKNQAVLNALNEKKNDKALELIKAIKKESKKANQEANQPQAEDQKLESVKNKDVEGVAALAAQSLEEYEAALKKQLKKLSEEQRALYKRTLKTKLETLEKTYLEALDYAETIDRYDVKGADENLKAAAKGFLKNRDNFRDKSFADSDLTTINNVWKSSDEFNKKITPGLKSAITQAKKKASEAAQGGTAGSHVESPASPQAPNPADSEKNEAPSSQDAPSASAPSADAPSASAPSADAPSASAPSADAPSADAPSAGAPSAGAPSEDEISDLDIEDDWLKEISDYLESPEFDDLMKSYNFDNSNSNNSNSNNSNSNNSNSNNSNSDDFNLDDFNLDDFNFDDFNLDDFDLSDFNLDDFDFSDVDLNA